MKKLITLPAILLFTTGLYAQKAKDLPEFGKVDKADLEMKECDFDKSAEAVVLFEAGELYCNMNNGVQMDLEKRVRIKILKDKGRDNADIHIRYHSYRNDESIKG